LSPSILVAAPLIVACPEKEKAGGSKPTGPLFATA
jgi:hypothetical protein